MLLYQIGILHMNLNFISCKYQIWRSLDCFTFSFHCSFKHLYLLAKISSSYVSNCLAFGLLCLPRFRLFSPHLLLCLFSSPVFHGDCKSHHCLMIMHLLGIFLFFPLWRLVCRAGSSWKNKLPAQAHPVSNLLLLYRIPFRDFLTSYCFSFSAINLTNINLSWSPFSLIA